MVNFEIISLIFFVIVIGGLLLKDKKNISFHYGIIVRRWTKGLNIIDRFVKKYSKFVKIVGNIGVGAGLLAGLGGIVLLVILTLKLQQTFALVLPTAGGYQIPGPIISVPFWYWLLAIFIIASTHETMHAIFIRLEKVPVKNYGILMLLLLPIGAFVDPDNKRMRKLTTMKKLRIFAAGSFINFATAILAVIILFVSLFLFNSFANTSGVLIDSVDKNSPAEKVGLQGIIMKIDDNEIKNISDFIKSLNNTQPGDTIKITTDKGVYKLTLGEHPKIENKSYVGVRVRNAYEYKVSGFEGQIPLWFMKIFFGIMMFLNWLFFISLGVGIVNMLPMKPLDGGLFFEEIFTMLFKKNGKILITITSFLVFGILLLNIFGIPLIRTLS